MIDARNKSRMWRTFIHENVKSKRVRSHFLQDDFQKIERLKNIYIYVYISNTTFFMQDMHAIFRMAIRVSSCRTIRFTIS